MQAKGKFIFKSLRKRDAGEFVNDEGKTIPYDASFVITVDEDTDAGIKERTLKFPTTNTVLEHKLRELEPYTRINLLCEIVLYSSGARVLPLDLVEE